jgi:hypothetical protein
MSSLARALDLVGLGLGPGDDVGTHPLGVTARGFEDLDRFLT